MDHNNTHFFYSENTFTICDPLQYGDVVYTVCYSLIYSEIMQNAYR